MSIAIAGGTLVTMDPARRVLDGESHGPDGRPAAEFAEFVEAMVASAWRGPDIERVQFLWLFRSPSSAGACARKRSKGPTTGRLVLCSSPERLSAAG